MASGGLQFVTRSAAVKRLLAVLLIFLGGCGTFVFQGALPPNGAFTSFSGLVSVVHLSSVPNNGTFISVTIVTFLQSGTSSNLTFCGNIVNQFPVDTMVRVNFVPASPCSTVQLVVTL
jgi:hypothetical protein